MDLEATQRRLRPFAFPFPLEGGGSGEVDSVDTTARFLDVREDTLSFLLCFRDVWSCS